jgi:hypothetical protein
MRSVLGSRPYSRHPRGHHVSGRAPVTSYSVTLADVITVVCSSLGPLPRNFSTASWDSPLEDDDPGRIEQVCGDRELETARCPAGLFDNVLATSQITRALRWLHDKMARDDHHDMLLHSADAIEGRTGVGGRTHR